MSTLYFEVVSENGAVIGITNQCYFSYDLSYIPATNEQIATYGKLKAALPEDHYPELHEIVSPKVAEPAVPKVPTPVASMSTSAKKPATKKLTPGESLIADIKKGRKGRRLR